MHWFERHFYGPLWRNGGSLGKIVFVLIAIAAVISLAYVVSLVLGGFARAAQVDPLNPSTWFTDTEAVLTIAGILFGWLVKAATALGKDWFKTEGTATVVVSAAVAVLIAGIGGYQMMGVFTDLGGGIQGAIQAAWMTLLAFLTANGNAKAERQAIASAVQRVENAEAHAKARLQ